MPQSLFKGRRKRYAREKIISITSLCPSLLCRLHPTPQAERHLGGEAQPVGIRRHGDLPWRQGEATSLSHVTSHPFSGRRCLEMTPRTTGIQRSGGREGSCPSRRVSSQPCSKPQPAVSLGLGPPSWGHMGMLSHFSHIQLLATLWTAARQAPLSMEFSRQEH